VSYFNSKKIADLFMASEAKALESEYDLEDLISFVKSAEGKIKFFENLKKRRNKETDDEIKKISDKILFIKQIMLLTLEKTGKKSVNFPGTGKITLTERKGKWVIDNESDLLNQIQKELGDEEFKTIVQTKNVYSKKDIDLVLDKWESGGKIPASIHKEDPTKTPKIFFSGDCIAEYDEDEMNISIHSIKQNNISSQNNIEDINELDF